jgi:CubicO group peptidase (beta-lactamase class C family)
MKLVTLTTVLLLHGFGALFGQSSDRSTKRQKAFGTNLQFPLDSLIRQYVDKGEFEGVILVANNGKPIYRQAFGLADRVWDIANNVSTKFRIASVTKPFTAVMAFKAIERGFLRLDGKIIDYLPDYPKKTGDLITIGNLLAHSSGLIDVPQVAGLDWNNERLNHSEHKMLSYFKDSSLLFAPGTDFRYSNFNYYLLRTIIAKVYKRDYDSLLQETIFIPAEMKHTSTAANRMVLDSLASGYYINNGVYYSAPYFDQSVVRGFGDIISTLDDLLAFDQALYGNRLLSDKTKAQMYSPSLPQKNNGSYGWFVKLPGETGPNWVRHSGSVNGYSSILVRLIDRNWTIILLSNRHGIQTTAISNAIKDLISGNGF